MVEEKALPQIAAHRAGGMRARQGGRLSANRRAAGSLGSDRLKRSMPDPRLAVLDALSSALDKSPTRIDGKMIEAAHRLGWTRADLKLLFPSFAWHRQMADKSGAAGLS